LFVYVFAFPSESPGQTSPDVPLPVVGLLLLPLRPESDCDRKAFRVGCFLALPPTDRDIELRCASELVCACTVNGSFHVVQAWPLSSVPSHAMIAQTSCKSTQMKGAFCADEVDKFMG
jgi:hypothetical protein